MRQLVHQDCYTRYQASFYLWQIEPVLKHRKVLKYYYQDGSTPKGKTNLHYQKTERQTNKSDGNLTLTTDIDSNSLPVKYRNER